MESSPEVLWSGSNGRTVEDESLVSEYDFLGKDDGGFVRCASTAMMGQGSIMKIQRCIC